MFAFELGREYRLSIAELYSLFPKIEVVYFDEKILLVNNIEENELLRIAPKIGGTIKISKIQSTEYKMQNIEEIFEYMKDFFQERKTNYAINFYGKVKTNQKDFLLKSKKYFAKLGLSTRFVNQDFNNIKSYLVTKEKLIGTQTDFNIIFTNNEIFIGNTIYVQDIESYAKRDFGKQRDMQIGMLPPKLAQMMINLSGISIQEGPKAIYDPFCGLGTILLEAIIAGDEEIYGSDINDDMVQATKKNIEFIKDIFNNDLKTYKVINLDAKNIANGPILKNHTIGAIVTEGYLGEIFGRLSINLEKVEKQRIILAQIYEKFFFGLKRIGFSGNIVISFPFWEIKGKYNYFEEIYEIINEYCIISEFFSDNFEVQSSRSGSLLYKRPDQTVGREIFRLKIK
ncbi:MAG: hypothetical protein WC850_00035 [Candidatus Gracilibacteria bacterium]